jgi:hypothetical protein
MTIVHTLHSTLGVCNCELSRECRRQSYSNLDDYLSNTEIKVYNYNI